MMRSEQIHGPKGGLLRNGIYTLLALVASSDALAQSSPFLGEVPVFVDQAANRIELHGQGTALDAWHAKLDRLLLEGEGQVNVVHIGGSHIQADIWSQQARHRLQHTAPGVRSARGLVFPYTMAKTNNPWWYQVEGKGAWTPLRNVTKADTSTLGLSGISITTRDTASAIKLFYRKDSGYPPQPFDQVRVLHRTDSSFAVYAWSADSTLRIQRRVDTLGGFTEFRYDRQVDTLRLRFQRQDSTDLGFTLYGMVLGTNDPGFIYHAVGVNGASTASYLRCQRFVPDLTLLKPDLVVFSVGINDAHDAEFSPARFKRNYADLIARVRQAAPDAAILLTTNTDSYFKRKVANRNAFKVREVMRQLAAEQDVAVWDAFGVMGGLGSIAKWESAGLAQKDRIHLNRAGYTLLGDLQVEALMKAYGDHLNRNTRP
jgi:lysophospholipase L1-like esterase